MQCTFKNCTIEIFNNSETPEIDVRRESSFILCLSNFYYRELLLEKKKRRALEPDAHEE